MAELDLIAPQRKMNVGFSLGPAYSGLCSLILLNKEMVRPSEWVEQTIARLSPEKLLDNKLACHFASTHFDGLPWPSFPAWVDDLATRDPDAMRDQDVEGLLGTARRFLGDDGTLPTAKQLLDDLSNFLSLFERLIAVKGGKLDRTFLEAFYALLKDPPARQELIVTHLRAMWEEYLAPEWERCLPMLQDSVAAFESLDYSDMPGHEAMLQITERDNLPASWEPLLADIEQVIFIPSAHIGPNTMLMDVSDVAARIVVRARIPRGATVSSPALSRSELIMRLGTLTDDTRLRILELLAREGEKDTKTIMAQLDLSQSSASRHLGQLAATGYVITRRHEGSNYYRLNRERIGDTLEVVKEFLK